MFSSIICRLTEHLWSPEDFNEYTTKMDIGDEATTKCRRCGIRMSTIEKMPDGSLKWTAHHPDAVLYELTDEGKKLLDSEHLKRGMQTDLDQFREEYK